MNSCIQDLAEQCTEKVTGIDEVEFFDKEKFAQLIVQECLDVVELRRSRGTVEVCKQECKAVMAEIKHHFGIEG